MFKLESSALVWEDNVVGFNFGEECVGAPQRLLGVATTLNMWDLVRCLWHDNLHRYPQPLHAISFHLVTISILVHQAHVFSEHFIGFLSCIMIVQSFHFLCNVICFPRVVGLGFSFHGLFFLCWFCDYE